MARLLKSAKLFLGLCILTLLGFGSSSALADHNRTSLHGAACQPANLGQSLNRDTRWSKRGVYNNQPEGGLDVFVVCPLIWHEANDSLITLDSTDYAIMTVFWGNLTVDVDVSCTVHNMLAYTDGNASVSTSVGVKTALAATPNDSSPLYVYDIGADDGKSDYESFVAICALAPQTGIGSGNYLQDPQTP